LCLLHAGRDAILAALEREHSKYEHKTYYPVAVAANDEARLAFVAVAWEYKGKEGEGKDRCVWVGVGGEGWSCCVRAVFGCVSRLCVCWPPNGMLGRCDRTETGVCGSNMAGMLLLDTAGQTGVRHCA
jgi:hypothetical protein